MSDFTPHSARRTTTRLQITDQTVAYFGELAEYDHNLIQFFCSTSGQFVKGNFGMRTITFLLLSTVAANAVDQSRVDLFLNLVRDSDCQMSDSEASKVLPANNFTRDEVSDIEKILDQAGMIDKTKMGVFALTKAACRG